MCHKSVLSGQLPVTYFQFQITCHPEWSHVIGEADDAAESKDPYITTSLSTRCREFSRCTAAPLLLLGLLSRLLLRRRLLTMRMRSSLLPRPLRALHFPMRRMRFSLMPLRGGLNLLLFFHQLRRFERLPVKSNLGGGDR